MNETETADILSPAAAARRRTDFFAKVRTALTHTPHLPMESGHGHGAAPAAAVAASPSRGPKEDPDARPQRDDAIIRQVAADDPQRVDRWIEYARKNGVIVRRCGPGDVAAAVDAFLGDRPHEKVLINAADLDRQLGLTAHLRKRGIEVYPWGQSDCRAAAFFCDAAITDCRFGLADTGAFLVWSDRSFGRSSTLTTSVHIVLLPANRIVADMIDGLHEMRHETAADIPSNVVIINGPSKTTDIESNLVTGVHGPKFLYAVVIE